MYLLILIRDMRTNKGTILKASVDYIHYLKKDQKKLKNIQDSHRSLENTNRKMLLRIQVSHVPRAL